MKRPVIWIFGKQLGFDGKAPEELELQMKKGRRLLEADAASVMLITGGITTPGFRSEAVVARDFVPQGLWPRIILEERSLSTRQNLIYGEQELGKNDIEPSEVIAVSSPGHTQRIKYLFGEILPKLHPLLKFDTVGRDGFLQHIEHKLIYWMTLNRRDERYFLPLKRKIIALIGRKS